MNIRRYYSPGQIVFITQIINQRQPAFHDQKSIALLQDTLRYTKEKHSFKMLAYVILPDHFHMLIQPDGESNFSQIMHAMKGRFTRAYKKRFSMTDHINFWQKRFWDHVIRDENDLENHFHYIHYNPIKHGYVDHPQNWKHSSYQQWMSIGVYTGKEIWQEPYNSAWGE